MSELRAATRIYLAALAIATAAVTVAAALRYSSPDLHDGVLAAAFCALQILAVAYPIELGPQQKVSLHTAVPVSRFHSQIASLAASVAMRNRSSLFANRRSFSTN